MGFKQSSLALSCVFSVLQLFLCIVFTIIFHDESKAQKHVPKSCYMDAKEKLVINSEAECHYNTLKHENTRSMFTSARLRGIDSATYFEK